MDAKAKALKKKANKFPPKISAELAKMGQTGLWSAITTAPKTGRIVMGNLKIMSTIPGRASSTTAELAKISNTIVKTFK